MKHICKFLWNSKRINLNFDIVWIQLFFTKKKIAMKIMKQNCEFLQLCWNDLMNFVIHWKLYHLHQMIKIKLQRNKNDSIDSIIFRDKKAWIDSHIIKLLKKRSMLSIENDLIKLHYHSSYHEYWICFKNVIEICRNLNYQRQKLK